MPDFVEGDDEKWWEKMMANCDMRKWRERKFMKTVAGAIARRI
jgi:hypothetical protein